MGASCQDVDIRPRDGDREREEERDRVAGLGQDEALVFRSCGGRLDEAADRPAGAVRAETVDRDVVPGDGGDQSGEGEVPGRVAAFQDLTAPAGRSVMRKVAT